MLTTQTVANGMQWLLKQQKFQVDIKEGGGGVRGTLTECWPIRPIDVKREQVNMLTDPYMQKKSAIIKFQFSGHVYASYFSNTKTSISEMVKFWLPVKNVAVFWPVGHWYVLFRLT